MYDPSLYGVKALPHQHGCGAWPGADAALSRCRTPSAGLASPPTQAFSHA